MALRQSWDLFSCGCHPGVCLWRTNLHRSGRRAAKQRALDVSTSSPPVWAVQRRGVCAAACTQGQLAEWPAVSQEPVAAFNPETWGAYIFFPARLWGVWTNIGCIQRVSSVTNWDFLSSRIPRMNRIKKEWICQTRILPVTPLNPFLYEHWEANEKYFLYWDRQEGNALFFFFFWSSSSWLKTSYLLCYCHFVSLVSIVLRRC